MNSRQEQLQALGDYIMDELRDKCPWDKKSKPCKARHLTIEETYELGEAILDNDLDEVKKEIRDLMLHLVLC
jgi:XTP/dITP diphosphohydrolase